MTVEIEEGALTYTLQCVHAERTCKTTLRIELINTISVAEGTTGSSHIQITNSSKHLSIPRML